MTYPDDDGSDYHESRDCSVCGRSEDFTASGVYTCHGCGCDVCSRCSVGAGLGILCPGCDDRREQEYDDDYGRDDDYPADAEDRYLAGLADEDDDHAFPTLGRDVELGGRDCDPWGGGKPPADPGWCQCPQCSPPATLRATWRKRRTSLNHLARRTRRKARRDGGTHGGLKSGAQVRRLVRRAADRLGPDVTTPALLTLISEIPW